MNKYIKYRIVCINPNGPWYEKAILTSFTEWGSTWSEDNWKSGLIFETKEEADMVAKGVRFFGFEIVTTTFDPNK